MTTVRVSRWITTAALIHFPFLVQWRETLFLSVEIRLFFVIVNVPLVLVWSQFCSEFSITFAQVSFHGSSGVVTVYGFLPVFTFVHVEVVPQSFFKCWIVHGQASVTFWECHACFVDVVPRLSVSGLHVVGAVHEAPAAVVTVFTKWKRLELKFWI